MCVMVNWFATVIVKRLSAFHYKAVSDCLSPTCHLPVVTCFDSYFLRPKSRVSYGSYGRLEGRGYSTYGSYGLRDYGLLGLCKLNDFLAFGYLFYCISAEIPCHFFRQEFFDFGCFLVFPVDLRIIARSTA